MPRQHLLVLVPVLLAVLSAAEREAYLQALDQAARLHGGRGEYGRAVEPLRRALREDALRESSVLQLMEWLWRNGDQAAAVRVYARLRDMLAARLQLEPDHKVTALYDAIRRLRVPPPLASDAHADRDAPPAASQPRSA